MIIVFEDNGQAYRAWKVNDEGLVVDCYPKYSFLWIGKYVKSPHCLQAGDHLQYCETQITTKSKLTYLRHKIASIKIK